jgi:hypothetical protein
LVHDDDLPKDFTFSLRLSIGDSRNVWKQCVGFFNYLVGDKPSDLRMPVPPPTAIFGGHLAAVAENQRKEAVQGPRQDGTNPRDFEDWLEFQPQRFLMLGLDPVTYSAVIWVTSQSGGHASD